MPLNPNIKYNFNQIKNGLIAFVGNLELQLQEFIPELPVFILQTGDTSYYLNSKFVKVEGKTEGKTEEVYQKIPRFVIDFEDIQIQSDQFTNQFNKLLYKFEEEVYICTARRMPLIIPINTNFVSSGFEKYLENVEIMCSLLGKPNPFTYNFLGNTFEGAYNLTSNSGEKPPMEAASGTRNYIAKNQLELQLHIMSPRIGSIRKLEDTEFTEVRFAIVSTANNVLTQNETRFLPNENTEA